MVYTLLHERSLTVNLKPISLSYETSEFDAVEFRQHGLVAGSDNGLVYLVSSSTASSHSILPPPSHPSPAQAPTVAGNSISHKLALASANSLHILTFSSPTPSNFWNKNPPTLISASS